LVLPRFQNAGECGNQRPSLRERRVADDAKAAAKADAEKKSAGKGADAKGPHSLRKCVSEGRTVYTDEKCPAGTREAPISEGNVTVMPSQRAGGKPKGEEKAK